MWVVVRHGIGKLIPEHDLYDVLGQQQRHVPVNPITLRIGRHVVAFAR